MQKLKFLKLRLKQINLLIKSEFSSEGIVWIENELLKLNQEITDEDRPEHNSNFLQSIPEVILIKDTLTPKDVAEAVADLVKQTRGKNWQRQKRQIRHSI